MDFKKYYNKAQNLWGIDCYRVLKKLNEFWFKMKLENRLDKDLYVAEFDLAFPLTFKYNWLT